MTETKKTAIKAKVNQYVARAEQLKLYQKQLAKKSLISLTRQHSIENYRELLPGFDRALKHAEQGESLDDESRYDEALQEYYKGIELCISICGTLDKSSESYRVVSEKTKSMMKRAEELTLYRDTLAKRHSPSACCIQ